MPYKSLEEKKRYDRGRYLENAEKFKKRRRERYRLKDGTMFHPKRKDKKSVPPQKDKDVAVEVEELKPGQKGFVDVTPYLDIRSNPENAPEDDLDAKPAPSVVDPKKKPGMKVEPQDEEAEKMSDDLNEVFDE